MYADKRQCCWEDVLWTDEVCLSFSRSRISSVLTKQITTKIKNEAFKEKNTMPTVKHGGGLVS